MKYTAIKFWEFKLNINKNTTMDFNARVVRCVSVESSLCHRP